MFLKISRLKRELTLALILILAPTVPVWAGFIQKISADMTVKSAYLVAAVEDMWLIDADAKAGVQVGDLFTVIHKGEPIIHPVTKETIGWRDEVSGVLRVTKVKSGYSYTEVVSGSGPFKFGTKVKRFANLPATFWDYTEQGEAVFIDLQKTLTELDWVTYSAAQQTRPEVPAVEPESPYGLLFILTDHGLAVKDTKLQPIRFYRSQELTRVPRVATQRTTATPALLTVISTVETIPQATGIVVAPPQGITMPGNRSSGFANGLLPNRLQAQRGGLIFNQMSNKAGVWHGPRMHGQPIGVDVGDFDGDGKNDIAICFKDRLVVAKIEQGQFTPLADYAFGVYGDALSLDVMDLNNDGRLEFYVSVVLMNSVRSVVLELQGKKLVRVIAQVPYFLRKIQLGSEGYVLLGQELNPNLLEHDKDLAGPIFRVSREGNHLQRAGDVVLPNTLTLYGFVPFESAGRPLIANININSRLQALEMGGASIWESFEHFGGSEASFERPDGLYEMGSRYAFLKTRIERGPNQTVLVPVNEGNHLFGAFRQYNNSHLRAVAFDGYAMVERWRTKPQGGYLADFRLADADNDGTDEIVMLVMFSHGSRLRTRDGNTTLLIYEMQ